MAQAWAELFPGVAVPDVLAQPCCAQFALSRERILSIPKKDYIFYRDWLLETSLNDETSGRVFEYLWHVIFTEQTVFCPDMHACYCDGYGICFEDSEAFDSWYELRWKKHLKEEELQDWRLQATRLDKYRTAAELTDVESLELTIPPTGGDVKLLADIEHLQTAMEARRQEAIERGWDPAVRAAISGRKWTDGDGF